MGYLVINRRTGRCLNFATKTAAEAFLAQQSDTDWSIA